MSTSISCKECVVKGRDIALLNKKLNTSQQMYRDNALKLDSAERYVKKLEARLSLGGFAEQCNKLEHKLNLYMRKSEEDDHKIRALENRVQEYHDATEHLRTALCIKAEELHVDAMGMIEYGQCKYDRDRLVTEVNALKHHIAELTNEHSTLKNQFHILTNEHSQTKMEAEQTLESLEELTKQLDQITSERQELFAELEKAYQELEGKHHVDEELKKAQHEAQQHHTCWGFAERERNTEKERRKALEKELGELREWTQGIERREDELKHTIATLESKLEIANTQVEAERSTNIKSTAQKDNAVESLQRVVSKLTDENEKYSRTVKTLEVELNGAKAEVAELQREMKEVTSHSTTLQQTLGTSLNALQTKESALKDEVQQFQDENKRLVLENKKMQLLQEHYKKLIAKALGPTGANAVLGGSENTNHDVGLKPIPINQYLPPSTTPTNGGGLMGQQNNTQQSMLNGASVSLSPFTPTPRKYGSGHGGPVSTYDTTGLSLDRSADGSMSLSAQRGQSLEGGRNNNAVNQRLTLSDVADNWKD